MFVTTVYSLVQRAVVSWERLTDIFCDKCVPFVEREREWLAQEYPLLKQMKKSVTKITMIFQVGYQGVCDEHTIEFIN